MGREFTEQDKERLDVLAGARGEKAMGQRAVRWNDLKQVSEQIKGLANAEANNARVVEDLIADLEPGERHSTPTGLTLTSFLTAEAARIRADWPAVAFESGPTFYDIRIREWTPPEDQPANYIVNPTVSNRYEWIVPRGTRYLVSLRIRDRFGGTSGYSAEQEITAAADDVPPAVPTGLTATGTFGAIWLKWNNNTEGDFSHYEVYQSATTTAPVAGTEPTYTLYGTAHVVSGLANGLTRHFWVRAVDTSGNRSAWSARVQASTLAVVDFDAVPATPGTPTYTTILLSDGRARVTITWAASPTATAYVTAITPTGETEVTAQLSGNAHSFETVAGATFTFRVAALNAVMNKSGWTAPITITAAKDTTAPATLTGFSATAGFGMIWLAWAASAATDLAYYEVYEGTTTTAPTAASTGQHFTRGPSMVRGGLDPEVTHHYWVRAVDTSGNKSAWSARVEATTPANVSIDTEALAGLIDETSFAANLTAIKVVSALPTTGNFAGRVVFLTTDFKLYRHNGTAWVKEVDGADLKANSIETGALAVGAVKAAQVDAGAIGVRHLLVADTANILTGSEDPVTGGFTLNTALRGEFVTIAAVDGYQGRTKALRLKGASGSGTAFTYGPQIPVTAGEQYYVELWAKAETGWAGTAGNSKLRFGDQTGAHITSITVEGASLTVGAWVRRNGIISIPAGCNALTVTIVNDSATGACLLSHLMMRRRNAGEMIVDGTLAANHLRTDTAIITGTVQIADAIITTAKIVSLEAAKIAVGALNAGITVGATGVSIGTVEARAADPAARVNAASTIIQPGKIQISGAATLSDWITPGQTTIDGGKITTDSVTTDQLAANSVNAKQLVLRDFTNMIGNGAFTGGNLDGWTSVSSGISVQVRDVAHSNNAVRTMPANYAMRFATDGTQRQAFPLVNVAVKEGEKFHFQADYAGAGTGINSQIQFRFTWGDANGADISPVTTRSITVTGTNWNTTAFDEIVAPAGAAMLKIVNVRQVTGGTGESAYVTNLMMRKKYGGELIVDGAVLARHVDTADLVVNGLAYINTAYITDANISGILSAAKIAVIPAAQVGTGALNAGITVGSTGVTIGTIESRASNPASRINAASTMIAPGKIQLTGSTSLSNWIMGGDETRINGGMISANTIKANALEIGSRNITLTGIEFEHNKPGTNQVSWTAGQVRYINDAGSTVTASITAGSATWTSGTVLYIYWAKGATTFSTTTSLATAFATDVVCLCTYQGGALIDADYGRTIIDGTKVKTGTLVAGAVNTASFAASGVAIFGGELKSTGFVAGSNGWRITNNGDAEFNNIISRSDVKEGAISDVAVLAPTDTYGHVSRTTLSVGTTYYVTSNDVFMWTLKYERRRFQFNDDNNPVADHKFWFDYRTQTSGTWSSWSSTDLFSNSYGSNSWSTHRQDGLFLVPAGTAIQFRIVFGFDGGGSNPYAGTYTRNIHVTLRAVRR